MPPKPSSMVDTPGRNESSFAQNVRLSTPGHRREQAPETVPPCGQTLTVPRPARRLNETPYQGSKASEDVSSPGGLTASAGSLRITESLGNPGPITESSPLGTNALHESNTALEPECWLHPNILRRVCETIADYAEIVS